MKDLLARLIPVLAILIAAIAVSGQQDPKDAQKWETIKLAQSGLTLEIPRVRLMKHSVNKRNKYSEFFSSRGEKSSYWIVVSASYQSSPLSYLLRIAESTNASCRSADYGELQSFRCFFMEVGEIEHNFRIILTQEGIVSLYTAGINPIDRDVKRFLTIDFDKKHSPPTVEDLNLVEIDSRFFPDQLNKEVSALEFDYYGDKMTVRLSVEFKSNGEIGDIRPVSFAAFGLTEKAIQAAKSIRFEPELKDGKPITVVKTVAYNFTIID